MAEEENKGAQSLKSSITSSPGKGLFTDTSPETQPERTYRFALNAMNESREGDQGFLINEQGNYECGSLGDNNWLVIGHVYTDDNTAVVFLAPRKSSMIGLGKIIEVNDNCQIKTILTSDCLNFSPDYPIQAIYRIRRGCERNIYFTDNNNTVRVLNLDSLRDYLKDGFENYIADNPNSYQDADHIWDCESMGMFPNISVPDIHIASILDGGGSLKLGAYQFAVAYQDDDLNSTNFFDITHPIPISADPIGSPLQEPDAFDIQGGANDLDYIASPTSKVINLEFRNVDTSYAYIRLVCIPSTSGTGNIDGDVWEIESIPISGETMEYSFAGWNEITTPKLGLDDILVPSLVFERAKTIEQIDNRLVLGNISNSVTNWAAFQQAANNIAIKYYTYPLYAYSTHHGGPLSYRYYADYRTFMRDEVYALGIVWIFRNGTESPVFHIPGRAADKDPFGNNFSFNGVNGADPNNPTSVDAGSSAAMHYNGSVRAEHNRRPIDNGGGWDTDVITTSLGQNNYDANHINSMAQDCNTEHLVGYSSAPDNNIAQTQRWNTWNTAIRTDYYWITEDGNRSTRSEDSTTLITEGYMGYYECRDRDYPDKLDCEGNRIFPDGKIRHHRMPDTTLEPHFYGNPYRRVTRGDGHGQYCLNTNPYCGVDPWIDPATTYFFPSTAPHNGGLFGLGDPFGPQGADDSEAHLLDRIITLGIKALNVELPEGIGDRIQGFKIVKGVRGEQDQSVIDKGLTFYNQYSSGSGNCEEETGIENNGSTNGGIQPAVSPMANWEQIGGLSKGWRHGENADGTGNNHDWRDCVDWRTTTLARPANSASNYSSCSRNNGWKRCMTYWFENTCGGTHSCGSGTGTGWGSGGSTNCFTEFYPFNGYPYPNLESAYCMNNCTDADRGNTKESGFGGGLFNIAYHGPLTKFNPVYVEAEYVKYERILVGRVNFKRFNTHEDCSTEDNNCGSWNYWYCSYDMSFIPTHDQGALFKAGAYDYKGFVKNEYDNKPLVNRRIILQAAVAAKGGTVENYFSNDVFRNGYFQQEVYVYEVSNSIYDYEHTVSVTNNYNNNSEGNVLAAMKVGIPYPFYRNWSACSHDQLGLPNTRFMNPPADSTCYQLGDESSGYESSNGYGGHGKLQSTAYYVSLKKNAPNAFGSLPSIEYVAASNKIHRLGKDNPSPGLVDDPVDNGYIIFGGDAFISKFAFRKTQHNWICVGCHNDTTGASSTTSRKSGIFHNTIIHYWVESYLNCEYRHSPGTAASGTATSLSPLDTAEYDSHYPYWTLGNINDGFGLFNGGFLDSEAKYDLANDTESSDWIPSNLIHINKYNLNYDYVKSNPERKYRSLPLTYDYCGACYENFPTRIVYSQQSFKEEVSDNYRIFFANNYSDIPGHRGDITNLFVIGNTIFAHCNESLWRLFKSRQEVKTDNVSLRIGTGAFLSEPPQEMAEAEFGYLGSQSQWATIVTESGTFFIDSRQGRVYLLLADKAQDLSNNGMRNFFENNLTLEINEQYKRLTGEEFPLRDNPHHPDGSGFIATYDSRHTRYILTKKSYRCLTDNYLLNGYYYTNNLPNYDPNVGALYLKQYGNESEGWKRWVYLHDSTSTEDVYALGDKTLFEHTGFTISWNISLGGWASFHSYRPNAYITLKNSFFSKENAFHPSNSVDLYRHGVSPDGHNYTRYYSQTEPFVVDFIVTQNGLTTFEYNNIHFITHASNYNSSTKTYVDKRYSTFNYALFYNSYQCSGWLSLQDTDTTSPTAPLIISTFDSSLLGVVNIKRSERTWSMNSFRDLVINREEPMFTTSWSDMAYQAAYSTGENFAVNSNAVGAKPWFEAQRFRDKYLGIRLKFSNFVGTDNCKLIFNYLYTQQTFSAR